MKKILPLFFLFSGIFSSNAQTLDVFSDGAIISVYSDSVIIDGNFIHQNNDTILNSGNIYLTGNWTNNNSTSKVFTNGSDGWLHLTGASQTIDGSLSTYFNNLELSGSGIKQLNNVDAEIEDTLSLNDREFSAGANTVYVLSNNAGAVIRANTITGGFVSSLNTGGLSRQTSSVLPYLFPVGSSTGTVRYRPVDLIPNSASANEFKVRMANVNPTSESFDVSLKDSALCAVNSNFYHRIFHSNGTDAADVKIYFDALSDGNFQTIAHWQNIPQWENTLGNNFVSGSPLSSLTKSAWNNFSPEPFALASLVPPTPTINVSGATIFCSGDSVILDAGSGYAGYLWSNGATSQTIVVTASGNYSVTVNNGGVCSVSSSNTIAVTVNPFPVPNITVNGPTTICQGDSVTLTADSGFSSYLWSTNETTASITVDSTGIYSVAVVDSGGCTGASASIQVTVNNPLPVITSSGATVFCEGGNVSLDAGSGFSTYLWSNGASSQIIDVDSSGIFSVTVTDASGCIGISSSGTSVVVNEVPLVNASPDDTINLGQSDTLFVNGALTYFWEPGNGSDSVFVVSPKEETTYTVIGIDANGCADTATVKIYVDSKCVYWLPNIFSPNGDGFNDDLKIYGRGLESIYLTIFDRWGNRVFEGTDMNMFWDGKYKDGLLNTGVYVYILKGKCMSSGEEFEQHGNITLTR